MAVSSSRSALLSSSMTFAEPFIMHASIAPERKSVIQNATDPNFFRSFRVLRRINDFEVGGCRSGRAMSDIVADAGAEVVTNGAGRRFFRIGRAHGVAPLQN